MAVKIQLRRGTTTQWNTTVGGIVGGTLLAAGEVGVNTTTNQMKVGDGVQTWADLDYFASGTITNVTAGSGITVNGTIGGSSTSGTTTVAVDTNYVMARNIINAKGDLIVGTANDSPTALSVGVTNNYPLIVNSGVAAGVSWGQIAEAAIATNAVTTTKIADNNVTTAKILNSNVTTAKIADSNVTTAKIADSNVTLQKLAAAVQNLLVPAGTIAATIKSTADAGWQFMGQTLTNAEEVYPVLFAVAPVSWRTGTTPNRNLVLPPMANKMLEGAGTTTLGASGGSNTTTIGAANLPAHFHDINHDHASQDFSSSHSHTPSSPYEKFVVQDQLTGDQYGVSTSLQNNGLAANNVNNTASATVTISVNLSALGATSSTGTYTTTDRSVAVANTAMTTTNAHLAVNYQIKAH